MESFSVAFPDSRHNFDHLKFTALGLICGVTMEVFLNDMAPFPLAEAHITVDHDRGLSCSLLETECAERLSSPARV